MRKHKWFVPVVVASILLIGGIAGGVVAAASDSSTSAEEQIEAANRYQVLLDRACAIYEEETGVAIDPEQLKDALKQARQEMREEALGNWLQKLVDNGEITQEEADQLLEWWQSRPDVQLPLPRLGGRALGGGLGPLGSLCGAPDAAGEAGI